MTEEEFRVGTAAGTLGADVLVPASEFAAAVPAAMSSFPSPVPEETVSKSEFEAFKAEAELTIKRIENAFKAHVTGGGFADTLGILARDILE